MQPLRGSSQSPGVTVDEHALHTYGDDIEEIGNEICPNLCCCADCHIDDYCHIGDDDGKRLCEIDNLSRELAQKFRRKFGIKRR